MKNEDIAKSLLSVPVSYIMNSEMFREIFLKYDPAVYEKVSPALTVKDMLPEGREEAFLEELADAALRYAEETAREVREFGVAVDPADPRFDWGTPEKNEAAVRLIEERYPVSHGDIICYGPSNMTLWYSLEQDMLPYRAQNHGMGGCTDPDLIAYAPRVLYPYRPSVVIMQTGSNDIAAGIPLDEILRRKEEMYALFRRELPETEFIVCSGLPLPGRMQFWEATVKTNALLEDLCARTEGLHFLDATDAMLADTGDEMYRTSDGRYFNPSLFRIDRIHLNKKGHDVWTGLMKEKLAELGV